MDIELRRNPPLIRVNVVLELGRAEERKDIIAVLKLADEVEGPITPEIVCQRLLLKRPPAFGRAVIRRLEVLGLLDYRGRLTEDGKKAVESGTVFNRERGQYQVTATTDPLIPDCILSIASSQPPSTDRIMNARRSQINQSSSAVAARLQVETPLWLAALEGRDLSIPGKTGRLKLFKVEPACTILDSVDVEALELIWRLPTNSPPSMELKGFLEASCDAPPCSHEQVFLQILGNRCSEWNSTKGALAVDFDELAERERASFRLELSDPNPQIEGYGAFSKTEISDIPLVPNTTKDAQAWARWLLDRRIIEHTGPRMFAAVCHELRRTFEGYELDLPSAQDLVAELGNRRTDSLQPMPRAFWFLQAPIDLQIPEADK